MRHDLPVAADWFAWRRVADGLTCLWEPHVHSLMQANVWHVQGRYTDLVVDAGLGVGDLKQALAGLEAGLRSQKSAPAELRLAEAHKRLGEPHGERTSAGALSEAGDPFAPGDVEEISGLISPQTGKATASSRPGAHFAVSR